ncbi:RES domain-containing protein [Xanthomonas arboricola]|uniref:RES domain-containing protein n=1 Tax=Xanthomonas arboricola TaxID=56448 RepID=UPI001C61358D|nr:RES domain-containing protein [Xanthomonas arboricola]
MPKPLKHFIDEGGESGACSYCCRKGTVIASEALFEYIYTRVRENVASEENLSDFEHNMLYIGGSDEIEVSSYETVLGEWLGLGSEVYFDDLCTQVPEDFRVNMHGQETHFYLDDGLLERNFYEDRWGQFIDGIRHAHRFFNPNARAFLDLVFQLLVTEDNKLKSEVIRTVECGTELYRARSVSSPANAKEIADDPVSQLGVTPKDKSSSQRMTPNGISALYCALERETCLSEIRSITGDDVVSVALTPISEVKLLDLTMLEQVEPASLTLLDRGYLDALHLKTFLKSLVKKMSKPKGRNDELSYLSTQVVFEYLRLRFGRQVDGLLFPSVQTGERGTNVVMFPETSRIVGDKRTKVAEGTAPDAEANDPPAPGTKLEVVDGSLHFHRVRAIRTEADTYRNLYELYLGDETRRRLGR